MKNYNSKSFFAGILFSVLLFVSFSFYKSSTEQNANDHMPGVTNTVDITPEQALTYRNNYKVVNREGLTAINLSVQQWEAINKVIANRNGNLTGIAGFRMYFGTMYTQGNSELVSIPYTLDEQLEEMPPPQNMPVARDFADNFNSQCPPFCD